MMKWQEELKRLRTALEARIRQAISGILINTLTASTTALGDNDYVEQTDEGSSTKSQRPATRVNPFGFNGRPPKGMRGISIRFGSSNVVFFGITAQQKYGPQDLGVGESAMYSIGKAIVRLWSNGNATVDAGGTGNVVLQSGVLPVARKTDLAGPYPISGGNPKVFA